MIGGMLVQRCIREALSVMIAGVCTGRKEPCLETANESGAGGTRGVREGGGRRDECGRGAESAQDLALRLAGQAALTGAAFLLRSRLDRAAEVAHAGQSRRRAAQRAAGLRRQLESALVAGRRGGWEVRMVQEKVAVRDAAVEAARAAAAVTDERVSFARVLLGVHDSGGTLLHALVGSPGRTSSLVLQAVASVGGNAFLEAVESRDGAGATPLERAAEEGDWGLLGRMVRRAAGMDERRARKGVVGKSPHQTREWSVRELVWGRTGEWTEVSGGWTSLA